MRIDGPQITGSFSLNGDGVQDLDVFATTSSLNTFTSSVDTTMGHVMTATHSLNTFTSSADDRMVSIESKTGSYATTGSNTFIGTQTIQGSIIPSDDSTYDLGSPSANFRHLYLSSASLYIDGTKVLGSTSQELQITTDNGQSFKILEAGSDTITLQSNDGNITLATSGGGDVILDPTTGIIALKGTTQVYSGNKVRSSDGNNIVFGDGLTVSGSVTITGFIEAQELRTTYISSSVLYRSGSTKFGDELTDTHAFTGSLLVSGSVSAIGSNLVSGSSQITLSDTSGFGTYLNQGVLTTSTPIFDSTTISGGTNSSQTLNLTIDATNGAASELVIKGGDVTYNRRAAIRFYSNQISTSTAQWVLGSSLAQSNGDSNFYLYSSGGTPTITATQSNYVGINKSSPGYRFEVYDAAPSGGILANLESGNAGGWFRLLSTGSTWQIGATTLGLEFYNETNAATRVRISPNGNVGINITPSYTLDVGGGSAFRDTLRILASDVNAAHLSWTSTNTGLLNLYHGGTLSTQILASGLSFFNGSIRINQDAALRAGSNDNWIIGQDSSTNLIHIGSTAVANDIRFDSSTAEGIVTITTDGTLYTKNSLRFNGTGLNATDKKLYSPADGDLEWMTHTSAGGHGFAVSHQGTKKVYLNALGNSYFIGGNLGINTSTPSSKLEVKASGDEDLIIGRYSGGSAKIFYVYQSSADGFLELRTGANATITKLSGYSGTPSYFLSNVGFGVDVPDSSIEVGGRMSIRGDNKLYWGQTTTSYGSWTTAQYASGSSHIFNAQQFIFTNEGYGSTEFFRINSSGYQTGFPLTSTSAQPFIFHANGNTDTYTKSSIYVHQNNVSGDLNNGIFIERGRITNATDGEIKRMVIGARGGQAQFVFASENFGIGVNDPQQRLSVSGSMSANRVIYSWFTAGTNAWDGYQYLHLKTNMWAGGSPNGQTDYTMSLFYGRLYSYSSAYIREGYYGFHNWSGSLYSQVTTGTFWAGGYVSSDGYVVLVVAIGGGTYIGVSIDWYQAYGYPFRSSVVSTYTPSNSTSPSY